MLLKSTRQKFMSKIKSKTTNIKTKKQILKRIEKEAYNKEQKVIKAEKKVKEAEDFLNKINAAKHRGVKKARYKGRTYKIDTLIANTKKKKGLAKKTLASSKKALSCVYRFAISLDREISRFVGDYPNNKPVKKRSSNKKPRK